MSTDRAASSAPATSYVPQMGVTQVPDHGRTQIPATPVTPRTRYARPPAHLP